MVNRHKGHKVRTYSLEKSLVLLRGLRVLRGERGFVNEIVEKVTEIRVPAKNGGVGEEILPLGPAGRQKNPWNSAGMDSMPSFL